LNAFSRVPRGVIAPILTPFNDDFTIATDLYVAHARHLLDTGCAAIAPFGTTGEALSVGIDERLAAIRALIDGGVDPGKMIAGTGLSNVRDTARLSRGCLELGCVAVMTLPPFYFKDVTEEGLYSYFEQLLAAIGPAARILLYHIPPVAIVGISPRLVARLHRVFPEQIVGIKDSVYPGSELPLLDALELGASGCISATANLNGSAIGRVIELYDSGQLDAARALHDEVMRFREAVQNYSPIPAQKRLLAISSGDQRWARVRPPLTPMSEENGRKLAARLATIRES
jgi:4-hydroxy-tetrahydrodipicolinate synthase